MLLYQDIKHTPILVFHIKSPVLGYMNMKHTHTTISSYFMKVTSVTASGHQTHTHSGVSHKVTSISVYEYETNTQPAVILWKSPVLRHQDIKDTPILGIYTRSPVFVLLNRTFMENSVESLIEPPNYNDNNNNNNGSSSIIATIIIIIIKSIHLSFRLTPWSWLLESSPSPSLDVKGRSGGESGDEV